MTKEQAIEELEIMSFCTDRMRAEYSAKLAAGEGAAWQLYISLRNEDWDQMKDSDKQRLIAFLMTELCCHMAAEIEWEHASADISRTVPVGGDR